MAIHGIGIDILHVPRIVALIQRRGAFRLASRILSPVELDAFRALANLSHNENEYCVNETMAVRFLGVRWAVKEAAYKALYPLRPTWKDFTYTSFDKRTRTKPELVFQAAIGIRLYVSVSHDGEYIVASVLADSR
ncbi:4'-phosphopantetheinyl transferase superfamily [Scleroderma yunnanense]